MRTRREFIGEGAAALAFAGGCRSFGARSIMPDGAVGFSPNYFCTWCAQKTRTKGHARDGLNEEIVFGPDGFADAYPGIRGELFLVYDDGWDVPYGADQNAAGGLRVFGAMHPHPARFPSFRGTPAERLRELVRRTEDRGWRGAGLWVCVQAQGKMGEPDWAGTSAEEEWKRKLDWCATAGVRYLKMDWGKDCGDVGFRRMLSRLKNEIAPDVIVEHCVCQGPVNGFEGKTGGTGRRIGSPEDGEILAAERRTLPFSDCWRIYDLYGPLAVPQGVDRTLCDLRLCEETDSKAIVSTEDCLYLGATLGCSFGVMRSRGQIPKRGAPTSTARRLAEVARAVRWERLAPAFPATKGFEVRWGEETLEDAWDIPSDYWHCPIRGRRLVQRAPAVSSRGLPLPVVGCAGLKPYVTAARNPNGAVSVLALPRIRDGRSYTERADVRLEAELAPGRPLGAFGLLGSLEVGLSDPKATVYAQDLAGGAVHDITASVCAKGGRLTIPGDLLARIGKESDSDESLPGTLVWCVF